MMAMQRMKGMKINEMLRAIKRIEKRIGSSLSNVQKILLTTDGSVTRTLEVLTGKPVAVATVVRTLIDADDALAKDFKIKSGEVVNYRVVYLKNLDSDKALVFARSWTPIRGLNESIRRDLTSSDIPIGKIIISHGLETRREIESIDAIKADSQLAEAFKIRVGDSMLSRDYRVIHNERVLIRIEEAFPASSFL
ncbi:MAG: chorismate pyruvate-lyase family protein [Nitrososphaerales archaeon]